MSTTIRAGAADLPAHTDVLVIGLGITGAGVALDAATRGLATIAIDAHDLAFGTSRWSSKLVHGGLRYLAHGQVDVAHESAVERGILMSRTAPHLVHALPQVLPLHDTISRPQEWLARAGVRAGDLLRLSARTSRESLPRPRRVGITETLALAPVTKREGLRGALVMWDGQLEDDARLVTEVARTAAFEGAHIRTRLRAISLTGDGAVVRDELTGLEHTITARAVISATGVWAGELVPDIRLRPSRGSHLVVRRSSLPHLRAALMVPVPGSSSRYVFALPQPDDTFYIGLTDTEVDEVPDVPTAPDEDVEFLLEVISSALAVPLTRRDVVGTYAGLRPLLDSSGTSADISRKHAVLTSPDGVVSVLGGKLTTYRRMAEDALDAAIAQRTLTAGPCLTRNLPLLGARPSASGGTSYVPVALAAGSNDVLGWHRLVRRFGSQAGLVLSRAREVSGLDDAELLEPHASVTLAELIFAVTDEGAISVDDLLDRRTRVGLVPADRAVAVPVAERALAIGSGPS